MKKTNKKENKILNKKWQRLNDLVPFFRFIPFVEFVLVSGSMAMGNVTRYSDFDVIIGAKKGRIFTTRLFCLGLFTLLGSARKASHNKRQASNKLCFNHFVTPEGYKLSPPYNKYWKDLYKKLTPIYGDRVRILEFFESNSWFEREMKLTQINVPDKKTLTTKSLELTLSGLLGEYLEDILKKYQEKRINKSVEAGSLGYEPQLVVSDNELRFHIDTKRVEEYVNRHS